MAESIVLVIQKKTKRNCGEDSMNRNKGKRYNEGASALTEMEDVSGEDGDQICNTVVEGDNG